MSAKRITHLGPDERKPRVRMPAVDASLKSPGLASGRVPARPGCAARGAEHHPRARPRGGPPRPDDGRRRQCEGPAWYRGDCAGLRRDRPACFASLRDGLRPPWTLPPSTRCGPRSSGRPVESRDLSGWSGGEAQAFCSSSSCAATPRWSGPGCTRWRSTAPPGSRNCCERTCSGTRADDGWRPRSCRRSSGPRRPRCCDNSISRPGAAADRHRPRAGRGGPAGGAAVDDETRGGCDRGRVDHCRSWPRSGTSPASAPRRSRSPISGSTRGCACPAEHRPAMGGSPRPGRRTPAACWSRRPGRRPRRPGRCGRSTSGSRHDAACRSPSSGGRCRHREFAS